MPNPIESALHDPGKAHKLQVLAALVTLGLGAAYLLNRNKPATGTDPATGLPAASGTTGATGADPVLAGLQATEDAIAHSASFSFATHSNTHGNDQGSHTTGGSGHAGISIFGIGIGGGGSKSSTDTWNLTADQNSDATLGGSNLSESEFDLLGQLAQSAQNIAAASQASAQESLITREKLYKH